MEEDLIYDIGFHKGEDSLFYLRKGFRVVAVEANPILCNIAKNEFSSFMSSGQLVLINAAISAQAGPVTFYTNHRVSVWGTTCKTWAERNALLGARSNEITVDGIEFDQLLEEFGVPYYLKVDIEGADMLCVKGLAGLTSKPKHLSIESNKVSWEALLNEFDLIAALGYTKFKLVDQSRVEHQVCPYPQLEGCYVDHEFLKDSSGLFGDEAPGCWLSKKEAIKTYRKIFRRYQVYGDNGALRSLRRRLSTLPVLCHLANYMKVGWYDTHASR